VFLGQVVNVVTQLHVFRESRDSESRTSHRYESRHGYAKDGMYNVFLYLLVCGLQPNVHLLNTVCLLNSFTTLLMLSLLVFFSVITQYVLDVEYAFTNDNSFELDGFLSV